MKCRVFFPDGQRLLLEADQIKIVNDRINNVALQFISAVNILSSSGSAKVEGKDLISHSIYHFSPLSIVFDEAGKKVLYDPRQAEFMASHKRATLEWLLKNPSWMPSSMVWKTPHFVIAKHDDFNLEPPI